MSQVRRAFDSYLKPFHSKNILAWILLPIQNLREINEEWFELLSIVPNSA